MFFGLSHVKNLYESTNRLIMSIEVISILVLFLSFFVLLLLKVPVAYSIGISTTISLLLNIDHLPGLTTIAQRMTTGIDSEKRASSKCSEPVFCFGW